MFCLQGFVCLSIYLFIIHLFYVFYFLLIYYLFIYFPIFNRNLSSHDSYTPAVSRIVPLWFETDKQEENSILKA